ncbi:cyclic nucleotide-binding domain-containing protein 2-like [Pomacea canaliculata]|uniref:cyclic nucleotide-binding domain-containing protein 2-like n=1 Tax=Pomacea canaliculata TaxID=400727 RepID=UPI000D728838|nr:cyclic nucleotide-binding domain-containing protein 2-like [Pomacea canaliculata]
MALLLPSYGSSGVTGRCRTGRRSLLQLESGTDLVTALPGQRHVTQSETSFERFKRTAGLVKLIVKICNLLKRFVDRHDSDSWSSVEMYLHFQQRIKDDLAFNPQSFTKAQPLNGGPKLQKLLAVHPSLRTSTHIKKIMAIIRVHRGFSDFPVHIQIQLCRCLQYELYEARRLLLRQGHRPTAFYLLLTGSLMVNIQDTHPVTGQTFIRTVSDLKQGDCFGELALLEQTTRTATIICKTQTELASISKEDFDQIVRSQLLKQRDQNILFCQKQLLFENFPCEVFYDNPDGFFFQFCPAGTVIVRNGQECAYILFVKSGKCRLISSYNSCDIVKTQMEAASREAQKAFPLYAAMTTAIPLFHVPTRNSP